MCTNAGRTFATSSRANLASPPTAPTISSTALRTESARTVAMPPMRGSSASMLKNSRTSSPWISPITRRPGVMRRALANSAMMSESRSALSRTQNERSFRAGRSGPRSMATKRSSSETSSNSAFSRVDLPVARSPKMRSVRRSVTNWASFLRLAGGERVALEQSAQRGAEHARRADLTGVHRRGVREQGGATRDEVVQIGVHLGLQQAAEDLRCSRVDSPMRARSSLLTLPSISLMSAACTGAEGGRRGRRRRGPRRRRGRWPPFSPGGASVWMSSSSIMPSSVARIGWGRRRARRGCAQYRQGREGG